jgi:hypothetical protein
MATQSTAIFVIACTLAATTATAAAQDPAYVNASPAASAADPARVGGPAAAIAPQSQIRRPSIATPRQETLQRLQRAEALQAQLAAQFDDGSAVSRDQRLAMQQWFGQSNGLLTEAWRRLGSDRSGAANPAKRIAGDNAAPMFDSLESLQRDPRAQQAQAAMDAMQRTLLPMLQDLRNDIDAELRSAAARSR